MAAGAGRGSESAAVAAFTETATDLAVAFDAGSSTDLDGTIVSYEWNFGDDATGTTITGADAKMDHTYAAAGTYTVTLTVVDNSGAKSTATHPVTVKEAIVPLDGEVAIDNFDRETVSGLGDAQVGGTWSVTGGGAKASVDSGSAKVTVPAGRSATMLLPAVATGDIDVSHSMWLEAMPTGGGAYLSTVLRSGASGDYRSRVRILADGSVQVSLTKVVAGTENGTRFGRDIAGPDVHGRQASAGPCSGSGCVAVDRAGKGVGRGNVRTCAVDQIGYRFHSRTAGAGFDGPGCVYLRVVHRTSGGPLRQLRVASPE